MKPQPENIKYNGRLTQEQNKTHSEETEALKSMKDDFYVYTTEEVDADENDLVQYDEFDDIEANIS